MINLIKNELFKLSHRKETKILLILAILLTIVGNLLDFYFSDRNEKMYKKELELTIQYSEEMMNSSENSKDDKVYFRTNYDMAKLKLDYPVYSPEAEYIRTTLNGLSNDLYTAQFDYGVDSENYKQAKEKYDEAVKKLDNFDWKKDITDEIASNQESIDALESLDFKSEDIQKEIDRCKEINRVLKYRLDNNIPVDGSNASNLLEDYIADLANQDNYKGSNLTREEEYTNMQFEKRLYTTKYMIDNNLIKEDKNINGRTTIADELLTIASGSTFMLALFAIFIASLIVPTEFDKGTIKQLLVRPYTRTEILVSKMIAVILYFIGFTITFMLISIIVVGLFNGFETINAPMIEYNYNTHVATRVGLLPLLLKSYILAFPKFLATMFIAIMFSVLTKSAVASMYIGFMLNIVDLSYWQKPIARFIISNCWECSTVE